MAYGFELVAQKKSNVNVYAFGAAKLYCGMPAQAWRRVPWFFHCSCPLASHNECKQINFLVSSGTLAE